MKLSLLVGRLAALAAAVLVGLTLVGDAQAYTFPAGATASTSCPAYPTDTSGPVSLLSGSAAGGTSQWGTVYWPGGPLQVSFESSAANVTDVLYVEPDSGVGTGSVTYAISVTAGAYDWNTMQVDVPAGYIGATAGAGTWQVSVAGDAGDGLKPHEDATVICDAIAAGTAQSLSNGETLSTIAADLSSIETELGGTLDVSTGGPTGTQQVILSPADRQLLADSANGAHSDVWDVVGIALGAFVCWMLVRALWRP